MQLAIVGSRLWNDYECVKSKLDEFVTEFRLPQRVISGNAIGIDKMAERWAKENNIEMCIMKPQYKDAKGIEQFGKKRTGKTCTIREQRLYCKALYTFNSISFIKQ
jgi:hypothetical protein